MNAFHRAGITFLCLSWITFAGIAQKPADSTATPQLQSSHPASSSDNARQLLLDVVVTDKSGKPVSGLSQQDFTVLDNKTPSKILSLSAHGPPPPGDIDAGAEIFLIVDEVNTTYEKVSYGLAGVKNFLAENNGALTHPVSLGFFSDSGLQVQTQPSVDGKALIAALDQQRNDQYAVLGVEFGGRLVGKEDVGDSDERSGDGYPLLLSAREILDEVVGDGGQPHALEHGLNTRADLSARHSGKSVKSVSTRSDLVVLGRNSNRTLLDGAGPIGERQHVTGANRWIVRLRERR